MLSYVDMPFDYEEVDLADVRTYPLALRASKARTELFGKAHRPGASFSEWVGSLPDILGARDLKAVIAALAAAKQRGAGIVWGIGAHVIKTGLSPIIVDLMHRGYVSAVAMTGAGIIHDFEVALSGGTSEDVDEALGPGRFGMADETGRVLNEAAAAAAEQSRGLGQTVAAMLASMNAAHADASIAVAAHRLSIPLTVHVALGTDIIHMHPGASGAALGDASLRDFRYFASSISKLAGGAYLNCGSAVVLPEVFLKAIALAKHHGLSLDGLTTVNIDFMRLYRPQTNVVTRPVAGTGRGYSLVGHHEILIPILAAALVES